MTIDSVVQKTTITLLVLIVAAGITWVATGDIQNADAIKYLGIAVTVGSLGAFALSMVNSFKRVISPPLVIAFAALEGVAIGGISKLIENRVALSTAVDGTVTTNDAHGTVVMAVLGTFAAVGGTLAAYKFFDIKVGNKFRTGVIAATFGFIGLAVLDGILGFFGHQFGFNDPFSPIGMLASVAGLVLGVFMLILDFDFVERGVAAGLPDRESWRAAFGLTVSIVWIYMNLLRIIAALRDN